MTTASIGQIVHVDVDGVPTPAIITHVHDDVDDDSGAAVVDVTAWPREAAARTFAGVHLHDDGEAAAHDDHNLIAYWPSRAPAELVDDVDDVDQGDEPAAAAPAPAKKTPAKKAPARR